MNNSCYCGDPPLVDGAIHVNTCHRFETCYKQQVSICCVVTVTLDLKQNLAKWSTTITILLQQF